MRRFLRLRAALLGVALTALVAPLAVAVPASAADPGDVIGGSFFAGPEGNGVYTIRPDGSGLQMIFGVDCLRGDWSPDGAYFVCHPWSGSSYSVWVMGPDGSNPHQVVAAGTAGPWVDDTHLTYMPWNGSSGDERVVDVVTLADAPYSYGTPPGSYNLEYSPDGTRLAYVNDGLGGIFVRDLVDNTDTLVVPASGYQNANDPQWSPDGTRIAFSSYDHGVIVLDLSTHAETFVGWGSTPSFSPDGQRLVFNHPSWLSANPVSGDVLVVNADGTGLTAILNGGFYPQWRRQPYVAPPGPTDAASCKHGGWKHLTDATGRSFKNQGDCVSYVATKGKNGANG